MTASLQKARQYATLRRTKVIDAPGGHRISEDQLSITFVMESGHKLTMTGPELDQAIEELKTKARATNIDTSDGVDADEASAAGSALQKRKKSKNEEPKG